MINTFTLLKRKMSQSSLISMHFKSTFNQTDKSQSNKIVINSIKKSRLDIKLKSSIVRLIERNQLLIQLKLVKSTLLKATKISNDVRILNIVDQVKELIVSSHADIKNFSIKILHQKVNKMMKKIDVSKLSKHIIIKSINFNLNFNFNFDQASKSNFNSEVAKFTWANVVQSSQNKNKWTTIQNKKNKINVKIETKQIERKKKTIDNYSRSRHFKFRLVHLSRENEQDSKKHKNWCTNCYVCQECFEEKYNHDDDRSK